MARKRSVVDPSGNKHEPVCARALSSICPTMSPALKGSVLSSSSRKLWEAALLALDSTIACFMRASTSLLTVSVLYLSSQYIVDMRYSCWIDSTGHRSRVMFSSVLRGLLPITRNVTAWRG